MFEDSKKKIPYKISVDDEDYTIVFSFKVNRSKLTSYFTRLTRKFPVKEKFSDIDKDSWGLSANIELDKKALSAINVKFKKHIKNVEKDVQKDYSLFRILSSEAVACEFERVGAGLEYDVKVKISGICI